MKTEAINYNRLYDEAERYIKGNPKKYFLDRKTEYLAYLVALETGLRVSDLLLLKYDSFSFNRNLHKYCFITHIKKTNSTHTGVISSKLYEIIDGMKVIINEEGYDSNDYIFYNYKTNKPYTRQWLHKRIKIMGDRLGFVNCGVHSIRKASAIKVLDKTGSLSMAQYHLTHKRATTTDKYLGVTQASALEQLAKVF
jgi:integrase